ncbi:carbonyl reductase [NADPH] 1-like protein [Tanacetum coccineum]
MYGHYNYGSHHTVGGSSSQPNVDGSSSQPNVDGSSSQPNVGGSSSPVRRFSLDDEDFSQMYSPQFSESFREEQPPKAEYGVPFTLLYCWEVLKESSKWSSGEVPLFMQEREDGNNKRYKSSGSSSFNTKESGEGSINLNTTVGDEDENEVEEVHRRKPMGRDQAKRKIKAGSASSASSFDVEALSKMKRTKKCRSY